VFLVAAGTLERATCPLAMLQSGYRAKDMEVLACYV